MNNKQLDNVKNALRTLAKLSCTELACVRILFDKLIIEGQIECITTANLNKIEKEILK